MMKNNPGYLKGSATSVFIDIHYGFEHVLRDDEATIEVAKYILANPVPSGSRGNR